MPISPLRQRQAYPALAEHHPKIEDRHLRNLFAENLVRGEWFSASISSMGQRWRARPAAPSMCCRYRSRSRAKPSLTSSTSALRDLITGTIGRSEAVDQIAAHYLKRSSDLTPRTFVRSNQP
jgi:hypothetical protein